MRKVSFDYDSTLSKSEVQQFAKKLVEDGIDVWVVTSRFDNSFANTKNWWWVENQNQHLFSIANSIGIKKENIIFTNMIPKIDYLKDKNFEFHLDDDSTEIIDIIGSGDKCIGINVMESDWKNKCLDLITD